MAAICTEVNHCFVRIHDYLAVLQTVGKVVKVYQIKKRPKEASLGYSDWKLFVESTGKQLKFHQLVELKTLIHSV